MDCGQHCARERRHLDVEQISILFEFLAKTWKARDGVTAELRVSVRLEKYALAFGEWCVHHSSPFIENPRAIEALDRDESSAHELLDLSRSSRVKASP